MPWHLNEALTDLSVLPDALSQLVEPPLPGDPNGTLRLKGFLETSGVNTDLIETDDIPNEYEGDEYAWLVRDLLVLVEKTGFVFPGGPPFRLTKLGQGVQDQSISLWEGGWIAGLFQWRFDTKGRKVQPVREVLEILAELQNSNLAPCPGLLLPEFAVVMRQLEDGASVNNCLDAIRDWRERTASTQQPPEPSSTSAQPARRAVCDRLAGGGLQPEDVYRARTTLIGIISSGLAFYGGLQEFESVQYAGLNTDFIASLNRKFGESLSPLQAITNLAKMPPLEVADLLAKRSPPR